MGNCNFTTDNYDLSVSKPVCLTRAAVNKSHFQFHYVIGRGGFGKVGVLMSRSLTLRALAAQVWKVEKKKTGQFYAMKEMSKSRIITKRSVNSVMNERKLLAQLKHPYALMLCSPAFVTRCQVPSQHGVRLPGQRKPVPRDRPAGGRRPALPHRQKAQVQRRRNE